MPGFGGAIFGGVGPAAGAAVGAAVGGPSLAAVVGAGATLTGLTGALFLATGNSSPSQ
jgi:hypothetical protein